MANLVLRRKKDFYYPQLQELLPIFVQSAVDRVLVCGDLSCTSLSEEFSQALSFIKKIEDTGIPVTLLPGNHDQYTKKAHKEQLFQRFFPKSPLEAHKLSTSWWLITLDTAIPTPLFCSHGKFHPKLAQELHKTLSQIPLTDKVLIANHFPIAIPKEQALQGESDLIALLRQHPQVKIYLHGHTHEHRILDLRSANLPIIIDSGCVSHKRHGSWNLLRCDHSSCSITPFFREEHSWIAQKSHLFSWRNDG